MSRDAIALPAGTRVRALVRDVEHAQRPSKGGRLELDFDAVFLGSERHDIRARVVSLGEQPESRTAQKAGIGAAVGGVLGAILGGKQGAIVGVLVGVLIPVIVEASTNMVTIVTPVAPLMAFLISAAVGVVFGLYPAARAAAMDPVEALRHE